MKTPTYHETRHALITDQFATWDKETQLAALKTKSKKEESQYIHGEVSVLWKTAYEGQLHKIPKETRDEAFTVESLKETNQFPSLGQSVLYHAFLNKQAQLIPHSAFSKEALLNREEDELDVSELALETAQRTNQLEAIPEHLRESLARESNLPRQTQNAVLSTLSEDPHPIIRAFVAKNPNCPEYLFENLSKDDYDEVRWSIYHRPNCPETILTNNSEDIKNGLIDTLQLLSKDERDNLAKNPEKFSPNPKIQNSLTAILTTLKAVPREKPKSNPPKREEFTNKSGMPM